MAAYYNEIDPYAASWLRNLIAAGHIAPGEVDERDIRDVHPSDIREFTQCHFFAGIGVWSYALRRAGWPDDRPVWTGSCPCQPFSSAGAGLGFADERHLWPHWHHLISECRPAIVIGEQVASKDADPWIDLVQADLEAIDFAFGAVPFPSASVGAPHIRDRLYWAAIRMGHSISSGLEGHGGGHRATAGQRAGSLRSASAPGESCRLADADGRPCREGGSDLRGRVIGGDAQPWTGSGSSVLPVGMADSNIDGFGSSSGSRLSDTERNAQPCGSAGRLGNADGVGAGRDSRAVCREVNGENWEHITSDAGASGANGGVANAENRGARGKGGTLGTESRQDCGEAREPWPTGTTYGSPIANEPAGPVNGFWRDADWLLCRDGKWRPVEPGTFPLAHGAPARVGRLRAYGNAINAEAARLWIETVMERMP